MAMLAVIACATVPLAVDDAVRASASPRITVHGSRLYAGKRPWRVWGMNWGVGDHSPVIAYFDNPTAARLATLKAELRTARRMGANSMRVYLELGQVMATPTQPRQRTLSALQRLLQLAQNEGVYLDITGNLVWRPWLAPAWYERMPWQARWQVQARFWRAVAHAASTSPAVLLYELTSEPIVAETVGYYYGELGHWWFIQSIATQPACDADALARKWTQMMARAIRSQDDRPVTIGLLPLTAGPFAPANIARDLDLLTVHVYPTSGQASDATSLIRSFAMYRKPLLLGETFMMLCDPNTLKTFLTTSAPYLAGTFEFFNGQDPRNMHALTISDAIYRIGLKQFLALRHLVLATQ
ncbi:MAG TPA: hypothetical protein VLP43_08820 [Solirubrobacteraceae bacterium]|nr:hypothetical protein [Solirubrobacteraceae bacterium]